MPAGPEPYVLAAAASPPPAVAMFAAILEDEGLTLVMTKADADITCKVITGSAHDHLFADWHRCAAALALLRQI